MFLLTIISETLGIKLVFFQLLGLNGSKTDLTSLCIFLKRAAHSFILCPQVNVFHWGQAGNKLTVG